MSEIISESDVAVNKKSYQVQHKSLIKYAEIIDKYQIDVKKVDINDFISFMNKHFLKLLDCKFDDKASQQVVLSKLTYDLKEMYHFLYRGEIDIPESTYVNISLKLLMNPNFVKDIHEYLKMVLEEIELS